MTPLNYSSLTTTVTYDELGYEDDRNEDDINEDDINENDIYDNSKGIGQKD
jgi:hypothetical protein